MKSLQKVQGKTNKGAADTAIGQTQSRDMQSKEKQPQGKQPQGKQPKVRQNKELVFNRSEKKYLIDYATTDTLIQMLGDDLIQDGRGSTIIRNLYLDTPEYQLIRRSIEKPLYKEKLRVRTYGEVTGPEHEAFLEIKKKLDGQVYKRRLALPLGEAEAFIEGRTEPYNQIGRELAWTLKFYDSLQPAISVVYERCAYTYPGMDGNVRITIDCNLAAKPGAREDLFLPFDASEYQLLLQKDCCVMEIKVLGAIPLELTCVLSKLEIYPTSFSKVGTAYNQLVAHAYC